MKTPTTNLWGAAALMACRLVALRAFTALAFLLAACGGGDAPEVDNAAPTLTTIVVAPASANLGVGLSTTLTAEARDQHGAVMPGVALVWASSDSGVAVAIDGVVTGVASGAAAITASSGGVTSGPVNLNVVVIAKGSIAIDKPFVFFSGAGQSSPLTAQIFDAQNASVSGSVTWTSSAPDKVSVDASGRVSARAIGSAQIVASGGEARSAPTLVVVAEPQPGALLVGDAKVVSVGAPPAAGAPYEVTLQGVAAPAPGTVLLGVETAPIAGKVVATRQEAAGIVVTLAPAPLYELFVAYDIKLAIDLSAFPAEAVSAGTSARSSAQVWNTERQGRSRALAVRPLDNALAPFRAFNCDASINPLLLGQPVQLALENRLVLTIEDRPGYSKHALEGSAAIVGTASIKLMVGFDATGRCDAQVQVRVPALAWASALLMPAVRFGLGAELKGKVLVVQGELGVTGKVSASPVLGWECGGATPECRGLNGFTVNNEFKTKSRFPDANGMEVDVSAHFYVVAGLDVSVLFGLLNAGIVEARVGPRQSFKFAFEDDQAARADYAASYELEMYTVVEPGPALQKAIKEVIDDGAVGVKLKAEFTKPISESPKGTHSVSKARVRPGEPVDFTVDFDAQTVAYWQLGYNIDRVDLYRKAEGAAEFVYWKSMALIASNRAIYQYRWTPDTSEAGKYQVAAFVNTVLPVPLLEVAANSVREVEVSCFSAPSSAQRAQAFAANAARIKPLATTCADVWNGESTVVLGSLEENITARASITWTYDPASSGDAFLGYKPTGSFTLTGAHAGCTVSFSPSSFTITASASTFLQIMADQYVFNAQQPIVSIQTVSCPGKDNVVNHLNGFSIMYGFGGGPFDPNQVALSGNLTSPISSWNFARP